MKVSEEEEYVPDRGDLVWLSFRPHAGHEQGGRRPAAVLSPRLYNGRVGLAVFCPITSRRKGYPFEVALPEHGEIHGVILADQLKSLNWRARQAEPAGTLSATTLSELQAKIWPLIGNGPSPS